MHTEIADLDKQPVAEQSSAIDSVPVIDISELLIDSSSAASTGAVEQIAQACQTWGFFQIINHGISTDQIKRSLATDPRAVCFTARRKAGDCA